MSTDPYLLKAYSTRKHRVPHIRQGLEKYNKKTKIVPTTCEEFKDDDYHSTFIVKTWLLSCRKADKQGNRSGYERRAKCYTATAHWEDVPKLPIDAWSPDHPAIQHRDKLQPDRLFNACVVRKLNAKEV